VIFLIPELLINSIFSSRNSNTNSTRVLD